jgi:hypothetical protein
MALRKDIFLVTGSPRSGTGWMVNLLNSIALLGCVNEDLFKIVHKLQRSFKMCEPGWDNIVTLLKKKTAEQLDLVLPNVESFGVKQPWPVDPEWLAMIMFREYPVKIINVVRHPIDVFLSQHIRNIDPKDKWWPRKLFDTVEKQCYNWNSNYWWSARMNPDIVLNVKYESLVTDGYNVMKEICSFLNVKTTKKEIESALVDTKADDTTEGVSTSEGSVNHKNRSELKNKIGSIKEGIENCSRDVLAARGYVLAEVSE